MENFIAPEFFNKESVDDRSDIFSAGVLLYFMLSGEFPFKAGNQQTNSLYYQWLSEYIIYRFKKIKI